jgi:hypothetical protein
MMMAIGHLAPAVPQRVVPTRDPVLLGASLHIADVPAAPLTLAHGPLLAQNRNRRRSGSESLPVAPAPAAPAATTTTSTTTEVPASPAAQVTSSATTAAPTTTTTPATTTTTTTTSATPPAACEDCDIDPDAFREAQRNSRYVRRTRERILRTHRAFGIAAWGTMIATEVLGTIQLINQDTWLGRGACASDPNSFGCRQSSLITGMHEGLAFTTVGLYLTAGVLAAGAPDPENASEGDGSPERRLRLHKVLAWVHGGGMILLPILGILSHYPQIVGATSTESREDFARAMRSIHAIVGYTTLTTLTIAGVLEF